MPRQLVAVKNLFLDLVRSVPGTSQRLLRVAIVVPGIVEFDGISNAIKHTINAVTGIWYWQVTIFTRESGAIRTNRVQNSAELARHPRFRSADVIIYHYGIYDELFEIISKGNGRAWQIVLFHNVTPTEFVSDEIRPLIAPSFSQMRHFHHADRLWPFTSTNADVLLKAGMDSSRITIVNPAVDWPPRHVLLRKGRSPIEILFVGRMTKSKGVLELLDAIEQVGNRTRHPLLLRLVGIEVDRTYSETVRKRATELQPHVEFIGRCEADRLERLYRSAHVLATCSYHEGFCRPVVEGLRAGCIPVGYASFHVPIVANGLGRLTKPGDITAFCVALQSVIEGVAAAMDDPLRHTLPLDRGATTIAQFDTLATAHVSQFTLDRYSSVVVGGIRRLVREQGERANGP